MQPFTIFWRACRNNGNLCYIFYTYFKNTSLSTILSSNLPLTHSKSKYLYICLFESLSRSVCLKPINVNMARPIGPTHYLLIHYCCRKKRRFRFYLEIPLQTYQEEKVKSNSIDITVTTLWLRCSSSSDFTHKCMKNKFSRIQIMKNKFSLFQIIKKQI